MEAYTLGLGKVIVNLHSLEVSLRFFLWNDEGVAGRQGWRKPTHDLAVGDQVPINAFSNYDSLGQLVAKFNARVSDAHPHLSIDLAIVDFRDILAHGRVMGQRRESRLQLVKFDKPKNDFVTVTHVETMDAAWFAGATHRIRLQLEKVVTAGRLLQPERWPSAEDE